MNKKLIWKFNIIDLLIIALVILSIIALIYKSTLDKQVDTQTFEITCVCENVPTELLHKVQTDASTIDKNSGSSMGSVSSIWLEELQPSESSQQDKTSPKPESTHSNGYITLKVEGVKNEHGILVGNAAYMNGSKLDLVIGDSLFNVYILNIK